MPRIPHTFGGFVTSFVTLRHWHLAPSQINPVNTVPSYFFKAHFNTALPSTSRSSWWSLCFRFYDIIFLHIAHFSRACNMLCPPHLPTLDGLNSICRTLSIVKLITILCYVPLSLPTSAPNIHFNFCYHPFLSNLVGKFPCSSYNPEIRFPIYIGQPNSIHSHLNP